MHFDRATYKIPTPQLQLGFLYDALRGILFNGGFWYMRTMLI